MRLFYLIFFILRWGSGLFGQLWVARQHCLIVVIERDLLRLGRIIFDLHAHADFQQIRRE